MTHKHSVLIIDDHPIISDSYKRILKKFSQDKEEFSFQVETVHDCDSAMDKINQASKGKGIDIIFLDIQLPPSKNEKILSGEDLGVKIKELLPNSKIIIATTYNDNFRIKNIFKTINPDGFLIKNDLDSKELMMAIETILKGAPFFSKSVLQSFRNFIMNEYMLDEIDRRMLYELSFGTKMKALSKIIHLSIPALEKRKHHLKEIFDVKDKDDRALIIKAKEKGFI